jgi:hypothetical protein
MSPRRLLVAGLARLFAVVLATVVGHARGSGEGGRAGNEGAAAAPRQGAGEADAEDAKQSGVEEGQEDE